MNFLKRIGYGWLLFTESFFSILSHHGNLTKIAACLLFALFGLLIISDVTIVSVAALITSIASNLPMLVLLMVFIIPFIYSMIYAVLYVYFAAFLQEYKLTCKAIVSRVASRGGHILFWVVINGAVSTVIARVAELSPSWSYMLSSTIMVYFSLGMFLTVLWNWLSLFVLTSIVLDNKNIIQALETSVYSAVQKIPELLGFALWVSSVGFVLLLFAGFALVFASWSIVPWLIRVLIYYGVTLLFAVLLFAYALFIVALYLSSTGRLVSGLGGRRLQEYFSQQAEQNNTPVL